MCSKLPHVETLSNPETYSVTDSVVDGFTYPSPNRSKKQTTRMHSSRMRTGRSLTICWSLLGGVGGRGVCSQGVTWSRVGGVSTSWGGAWSGGCLLPGGLLPGLGGCLLQGGVCSWGGGAWSGGSPLGGCLFPGGCLVRGDLLQGGYPSMHWGRHPSPPVDRHTPVKILPWPNFVAAGKYRVDVVPGGLASTAENSRIHHY